MTPRERWLTEGLTVLAERGAPSLRIDGLAERLGMTKGSFYHHFDGMAGYRRDLLALVEEQSTTRYIEAAEAEGDDPARKLRTLMDLVLAEWQDEEPLEVAVRAWALQDADARAAQERIDAIRVDYLRDVCQRLGVPKRQALDLARMFYLLLVGATSIVPSLGRTELRRQWELALSLLPEGK